MRTAQPSALTATRKCRRKDTCCTALCRHARPLLHWHCPLQLPSPARAAAQGTTGTRLHKLQAEQPNSWGCVLQVQHQRLQLSLCTAPCSAQLGRRPVVAHAAVQAVDEGAESDASGIMYRGGRQSGRECCSMQRAAVLAFINHSANYKNKLKHTRFFPDKITVASQCSTSCGCSERLQVAHTTVDDGSHNSRNSGIQFQNCFWRLPVAQNGGILPLPCYIRRKPYLDGSAGW